MNPFVNIKLGVKFALMAATSVLVTAVALVSLAVWQSGQYNKLAQSEVEGLINADLDHITQGAYNLVRTENEAVQVQVNYNLNVARHILEAAGSVSLSSETIQWTAVNQFTNESTLLQLPKMLVGNVWLGENMDLNVPTPVVDEVTRLVGETATIFQRINKSGDMLRVATTVKNLKNQRAIGTYIPAVNPDGTANPVISTVLNGGTYHGRAYVVTDWYLTAYEPIKDDAGELVGMLYVGIQQKAVEHRVRQAILQTQVGKTGYVYVLGGRGEDRGRYIISAKGQRDGEDIWSTLDNDGRLVIQDIINRAVSLKPEEMITVRYQWQNPGESEPRWKIARLAYYAPWDWVIGTSVYEDELQVYSLFLSDGRLRMTRIMGMAGLVIIILVGMTAILITWTITRPVRRMTEVAEKIIEGDLDQVVEVVSHDEIGVLARTFNLMTGKLKQSMEGLKKSEEKYRGIFENALEGLFQYTLDGRLLSSNPAMARILGYASPEELLSGKTDLLTHIRPEDRDAISRILLDQGEVLGFEVQCFRKDKTVIWTSITARMVYGGNGKPVYIEGFLSDITDQKRAEDEKKHLEVRLAQSQKMESIGTLAGGIAHDFNNILSAIIGYTELALDNLTETDTVKDELGEVLKAGGRAKELVKQILTFSRMTETEYSPIALRTVVKESLKMLRSVIPSTVEIKENLAVSGLIMSDPTQINQIMINLCTNAAHAMDETGGTLEVNLSEASVNASPIYRNLDLSPGPYLKLTIRDTGKGIAPEIMERIFEPYFTTKALGRGTGLGLSVVHGIVKSHNGAITCKSTVNGGTTFDIYLPKIQPERTASEQAEQKPIPKGTERILFVDDEKILATLAEKMLGSMGYTVVSTTSSNQALELFCKDPHQFDLVITDMTMPGMTGDRLTQELIAVRKDIPVILCTGYNEHITEKHAKALGIREFILKPVDMRTMTEAVRRVLDAPVRNAL